MGLFEKIKNDVKKSGASKSKIMYFRESVKYRIRFLSDMEDGMEIVFHDSFQLGINVPCQDVFGKECKYCEMEGLRTRSQYCWTVWDYESNEVKLFMFPVNNCTPLPALMALFETYGTLTDRDYVISVTGRQQNKTFSVVPMDKVKFRNAKAKPLSSAAILKIIDKAFPADDDDEIEDDEDEVEEKPSKQSKSTKSSKTTKSTKPAKKVEDDEDDEDSDGNDYESMSDKELYKLCVSRNIEAEKRKPKRYYIKLLEEADEAEDDWDDEDEDDDEWEDDE